MISIVGAPSSNVTSGQPRNCSRRTGFGLAFAAFVLSAATCVTVTICITYVIDTYPDLSGEAMITVIVIRNTMGFAITSYA